MASVRINDAGVYEVTSGNYSAVDAYEPGSVGKVITIAGALNEGTVTPDTTFVVPWQKRYTERGDLLHDSHMHGDEVMSVEQILVESSNIGTITVSETMGFERQYDYMRQFGLGEKTALDFPDETAGILEPVAGVGGHGEVHRRLRPGRRQQPDPADRGRQHDRQRRHLRRAQAGAGRPSTRDGEVHEMPASATHEVVRPEIAEQMQQMMREVVCRGTAKQAQVPGLSIAGKTGTGFIAQPDGGYLLRRRHEGLLRQLRRLPAGRGPAGHDPRVDRPAAGRQQRPLRRHRRRAGVPRAGADDDPRARHRAAGRVDRLRGVTDR